MALAMMPTPDQISQLLDTLSQKLAGPAKTVFDIYVAHVNYYLFYRN